MRLVFIVNHAAFFVSHRLPVALEALRRGWEVTLITGRGGSDTMELDAEAELRKVNLVHYRLPFGSATVNPFREFWSLIKLIRLLRKLRPDIVHGVSQKGILYGGIAARASGVPALVLAISGMGYAFADVPRQDLFRKTISRVISGLSRVAFRHRNMKVIVQNSEDEQWVKASAFCSPKDVHLIPGSGVDLSLFDDGADPANKLPVVVLPARLLREKGVVEFVEAARHVRKVEPGWRFVLAGAADYRNPSMVSRAEIDAWVAEGVVEWPGHVRDIVHLISTASIVCLPSYYREGIPKVLLEAAAAGCAVVTADSVGCRDAVVAGKTADLVPVRDVEALANTLLALIRDRPRREAYGRSGRRLAREKYSLESVVEDTFEIYATLGARV